MQANDQTKKRGRPAGILTGRNFKMYPASLDQETVDLLRVYGNGNFSKGVRMAAQFVKEQKFSK